MFSEETNGLIDEAMAARDTVIQARDAAKEKAAAQQSVADEATTANAALSSATADLDRASKAAIAAITQEFSAGGNDQAAAPAGARKERKMLPPQSSFQK